MADRATERKPSEVLPEQILQFGRERTDTMLKAQKELLDAFQDAGRTWATRMESEIKLWNEFAAKLTASRSLPEGIKLYNDCIAQRMQMVAEDGRHLFDDVQRLWTTVAGSLNGQKAGIQ